MGKASEGRRWRPFGAGNNQHAAATGSNAETNKEYLGQLTQVLSNRALNEIKVDYLRQIDDGNNCQVCMGRIDARNGPVPANIEALFQDPFNADTWNLAAISPLTRTYDIGIGDFTTHDTRPQLGAWIQDDWQMTSNLTLNLGFRYDLSVNASGNEYERPRMPSSRDPGADGAGRVHPGPCANVAVVGGPAAPGRPHDGLRAGLRVQPGPP